MNFITRITRRGVGWRWRISAGDALIAPTAPASQLSSIGHWATATGCCPLNGAAFSENALFRERRRESLVALLPVSRLSS